MHITCVFEYMRYTGCTYQLYIFIYSISSLCVSREMVYLQILSLHLPMDYVFWYCFLFMRFSDLKNNPNDQARVASANILAAFVVELLEYAMETGCFISIENPLNSWMWLVIEHYVKEKNKFV